MSQSKVINNYKNYNHCIVKGDQCYLLLNGLLVLKLISKCSIDEFFDCNGHFAWPLKTPNFILISLAFKLN